MICETDVEIFTEAMDKYPTIDSFGLNVKIISLGSR